jgi:hypothetical protein
VNTKEKFDYSFLVDAHPPCLARRVLRAQLPNMQADGFSSERKQVVGQVIRVHNGAVVALHCVAIDEKGRGKPCDRMWPSVLLLGHLPQSYSASRFTSARSCFGVCPPPLNAVF